MLNCCQAVLPLSFALAIVATMLCVAGCDSQQAAATASGSAAGSPTDSTGSLASDASAVKPGQKLRPGAKTKVLPRAGDRPYDKTFDDLRFDMTAGQRFHRSMLTKQI